MSLIRNSILYVFIALNTLQAQNSSKIANDFFNFVKGSDYKSAFNLIDSTYIRSYTPEYLKMLWFGMENKHGAFQKSDSSWEYNSSTKRSVFFKLQCEKGQAVLKVNISKNLISGISILPFVFNNNYKLPSYYVNNIAQSIEANIETEKNIIIPCSIMIPSKPVRSKVPIVILVHGSGPSNRDEDIGPNKPFKDLAIGLAKNGIATIRYEKRTLEYEDFMRTIKDSMTIYDETINDALAISKYASTLDRIDPDQIFILGHSLGAMCAPKICSLNNKIKGAILMAAPSRKFEDVLIEQIDYVVKLDSTDTKLQYLKNTIKYQVSILNSDSFGLKTKSLFLPFGIPAKYWISLKRYNQVETLNSLSAPFLILQGERDYQVNIKDYNIWKERVTKSNVMFKKYSKLNHLFMEGEGKSIPKEYEKASNIPPYVIDDISKWIKSL